MIREEGKSASLEWGFECKATVWKKGLIRNSIVLVGRKSTYHLVEHTERTGAVENSQHPNIVYDILVEVVEMVLVPEIHDFLADQRCNHIVVGTTSRST